MEKEKERHKIAEEDRYAKVEACVSVGCNGDRCYGWYHQLFFTVRRLGMVYGLHRCISHSTGVNEKAYERMKTARFSSELFSYASFFVSLFLSVSKWLLRLE